MAVRTSVRLVLLEVRRSNRAAIKLYRSLAFSAMWAFAPSTTPDTNEDAVEMALTLDPATGALVLDFVATKSASKTRSRTNGAAGGSTLLVGFALFVGCGASPGFGGSVSVGTRFSCWPGVSGASMSGLSNCWAS